MTTSADRLRVLFLCTGNSARSQTAEALLRHLSKGAIDVFSAGSAPQPAVHPLAKETLEYRYGIETDALYPKSMNSFIGEALRLRDYGVRSGSRGVSRVPGDPERIHWSFEDPAAVEDEGARRRAFARVANGIAGRLRVWMALPAVQRRLNVPASSRAT